MVGILSPNNTKIIITVGPASDSYEMLNSLIDAGVDVFRINTSHGKIEDHLETIRKIKELSDNHKCHIPILIDLQGPKIRLGILSKPINLIDGQELILTTKDKDADDTHIPVDYKNITNDVKEGDNIFINDGKVQLRATWINQSQIGCAVVHGGEISSRKGINLPGAEVSTPTITERDKEFIKFGVENDVSYIALSFVRSEKDIIQAKEIINDLGGNIPVIAKIEKPQALERIDQIIHVADGIMVARGDLGIELSPEKVPLAQKLIVKKTNLAQKPVIIATQMLESMIDSPIPTRAETNDVANSILDGADAIMLSAETSVGKFPVEAVSIMEKIADEIENSELYHDGLSSMVEYNASRSIAINHDIAISSLYNDLDIKAVVAVTDSGYTAEILSKARIKFPIVALSNQTQLCNQLNLLWGILPVYFDIEKVSLNDESLHQISDTIIKKTFLEKNDKVLIIAGLPYIDSEKTTKIRLYTL